jgi:uncharacterized protein involved in exopolysaccharide biosynthesis
MNPTTPSLTPAELVQLFRRRRKWWLLPALFGAVIAALLTLVLPRQWKSTQALIVRPEVAGQPEQRLGKFADLSEMKTLQETVLELARSQGVLESALAKVGPPDDHTAEHWPTSQDIVDLREQLRITPPGGAEFGQTEVFYLSVRDSDRARSAQLAAAVCDELLDRVKQLRNDRAQSMTTELAKGLDRAHAELQTAVEKLTEYETSIGPDLAELRYLISPIGGQSELSQQALGIEEELRTNAAEQRQSEKLRQVLLAAQKDPKQLITTPSALLTSQPSLERLKAGLIDSQLTTASLLGSRSAAHPLVAAAKDTQSQIQTALHHELPLAIAGVETEIDIQKQRETTLKDQLVSVKQRVAKLAESRASYAALAASVENQTRLVDTARKQLADAQAQQAGASSVSLVALIDGVETDINPVGLSRATITAAGGISGLFFGLGLLFMLHGPQPESPARMAMRTENKTRKRPTQPFGWQKPVSIAEAIRRAAGVDEECLIAS